MATASVEAVEDITSRLDSARVKWWGFSLGTCLALAAFLSLGALIFLVTLDAAVRLSQLGLAIAFGIWALLTLSMIVLLVIHQRRCRRSLEATARRVEMEFPDLESHLINFVQFSDYESSDGFHRAAMAQAARLTKIVVFDQAARRQSPYRRIVYGLNTPRDLLETCLLLAGVVALGFLLSSAMPGWASSWWRVLKPWDFVPSVGRVQIFNVSPGDSDILIGSSVDIVASIDNADGAEHTASLFVSRSGEDEIVLPMQADNEFKKFRANLAAVNVPTRYRLEIGDSQTAYFTLKVRQKPAIAEVEVTYFYPSYLGRPKQTVTQKHADLEAPQFTIAHLAIRPLAPIARGHLIVGGQQISGMVRDGMTLNAILFLKGDTTFTAHMFTDAGQTDSQPRVNQIRVVPDLPPTVELVQPAPDSAAPLGKNLTLLVRAADDHGLGQVRIEMKSAGAKDDSMQTLKSWDKLPPATNQVFSHDFMLEKKRFKAGETILLRALAQDRRQLMIEHLGEKVELKPQETASRWQPLRIISADDQAKSDLARMDSLRAGLWKILQLQMQTRIVTAKLGREKSLDAARPMITDVQQRQTDIQKATVGFVASIKANEDAEQIALKQAGNKLALGDMLLAVKQAGELQRIEQLSALAKPGAALSATQDRIIDVLRRMLNELRRESSEVLAQVEKRPGTDLPSDVQNKLRDLKDKLDDFLKQQKKVIEATDSLAKKPVEDFSDKDEQKLKELAGIEDDWSRFMADRHSDFSKLPEQDFSNPSFLDELVEIQTELKMAKDALTKKSADIAVPLEQLGAEMAKEMTTNIEKWLPDTPDRERWSQEEPLTDAMKEAPMAELSKELEDLVGELMEQEDDLFDEMEDLSSSWADSIDKGAGWDAADGPISNMSARGVTGNRLPNKNEIGGRSGEGRQGQSSGEFVSNTAVGKGGRKTPSRLTPDPHVKGQVKDVSKDPVGGATGGGKESGQGGEGLHGPVPNRPEREMQRLASKQAELRNKAEGVDLRFKVLRYHHSDLKKLIETMAAVETDLRGGRYQNALRRRQVLIEGLGQVRTYLKGEFAIRKDQTSNLPTNIQKEILGSMQEPSPSGWEALNRQYFERLGSANSPSAAKKKSP